MFLRFKRVCLEVEFLKSEKVSIGKKVGSIIGISLASILIIVAFCGRYLNSGFRDFANFFVGSFGMSFYGLMAAVIVTCSFVLAGKSVKIPAKYAIHFVLLFVAIALFVHTLTTLYIPKSGTNNFSNYISLVYHYYDGEMGVPTFGGVVFGIIAYALEKALTIYGAMVVIVGLLGWTVYMASDFFYKYFTGKLSLAQKSKNVDIEPSIETTDAPEIVHDDNMDARQKALEILFSQQEATISPVEVTKKETVEHYDTAEQSKIDTETAKTYDRAQAEDLLFGKGVKADNNSRGNTFFAKQEEQEEKEDDFIVRGYYQTAQTSQKKDEENNSDWKISYNKTQDDVVEEKPQVHAPIQTTNEAVLPKTETVYGQRRTQSNSIDIIDATMQDDSSDISQTKTFEPIVNKETEQVFKEEEHSQTEVVRNVPEKAPERPVAESVVEKRQSSKKEDSDEVVAVLREDKVDGGIQIGMDFLTKGELEKTKETVHQYLEYNIPPFELLNDVTITQDYEENDRKRSAEAITNKLAVFGIKVEIADIIVGPSVTRYTFRVLSQKTRMGDFRQYSDDIKACVEAQEDIRIEAPIHGTGLVGIEVANKKKTPVVLRGLLDSDEFTKAKGNLVFAIGREITGKVIVADLADMPHLLIAGTTGSGKSVCLNCLIVSMMYKYGPEYVRFLMVDPKFVELSRYNGIPHMLTAEAITNVQDALGGMDYLINEMEARYQLFRASGVGNISEYNSRINPKITQKLPYLVFVVDELADLMSVSKKAFEQKLMRLAQKSRAAGIHIVLATQRPSVDVITGTIKANLPCRMALKVASQADSSTILNGGGAEKLLGKGDMLFLGAGASDTLRVQSAYISNDEIRALVEYSKSANEVYYDSKIGDEIFVTRKQELEAQLEQEAAKDAANNKEPQLDPYCRKALRFWLEKNGGRASISSIQRGLGIGFNRAGRIMDSLQKLKYVEELSASDPSNKQVRVLVTLEELDELFPDMED